LVEQALLCAARFSCAACAASQQAGPVLMANSVHHIASANRKSAHQSKAPSAVATGQAEQNARRTGASVADPSVLIW